MGCGRILDKRDDPRGVAFDQVTNVWLTLLVLDTFSHQLDDVLKCSEVDPLKDLVDDGASGLGASTHVRAVTGVFGRVASGGFPHQVAFVGLGWRNGLIGIANAGTVRKTCVVPTQSARRHDRTTRRGQMLSTRSRNHSRSSLIHSSVFPARSH